jgi:hypoxanthine-guanine phosphoribosyltransferase
MAHCKLGFVCALIHLLTVPQVVSGKYVMIVDVIIDEQESLNTVLMVCHPLLLVCMMLSRLREREREFG